MTKKELKSKIKKLELEATNLDHYQNALKIMMNSAYGALGNRFFRYYNLDLASAVTLSGQLAIKWIENYIMNHPLQKKYKWKVVYSDTDSGYISIEYIVNKILEKKPNIDFDDLLNMIDSFNDKVMQPIINKGYEELREYVNANENRMFMKREKIIKSCMWTGKKKYGMLVCDDEGVRYKEPKLKVKGFEIVRSSTPKVCRDSLKEAVKLILKDQTELVKFVKNFKVKFMKMTPEEIAFPRGVNNISKYESIRTIYRKGTPIHVRAAITYNNYIRKNKLEVKFPIIQEGEKVKFIFLRMPNPWHENVIAFIKHLPKEVYPYVDYPLMYKKAFYSVLTNFQEKIISKIKFKDEIDINDLF